MRGKLSLGEGEDHADRIDLGDDDDAVGVAGLEIIARVDLAQADAPGDRRGDPPIAEVQRGGPDRRPVPLDRGLELGNRAACSTC